jgi:hypothetical protein
MAIEIHTNKRVKYGDKPVTMTVRLGESTLEWLAREAEKLGVGPSTLARMYIIQKLGEVGGKPPYDQVIVGTRKEEPTT